MTETNSPKADTAYLHELMKKGASIGETTPPPKEEQVEKRATFVQLRDSDNDHEDYNGYLKFT